MELKVEITPLYDGKFVIRTTMHYEDFHICENLSEVLCRLSRMNWWPENPLKDVDIREPSSKED